MSAQTLYLSALTRARLRRRGSDGLTKAERAEYAARWRAGVGARSTRAEVSSLRADVERKRTSSRISATG